MEIAFLDFPEQDVVGILTLIKIFIMVNCQKKEHVDIGSPTTCRFNKMNKNNIAKLILLGVSAEVL